MVEEFDSSYWCSSTEAVLWSSACAVRQQLLQGEDSRLFGFVCSVRDGWNVRGASDSTCAIAAAVLKSMPWSPEDFSDVFDETGRSEEYALRTVSEVLSELERRGAARQERSLTTKMLHWLMPWRIPVYDSFVCKGLRTDSSSFEVSYPDLVKWEYATARELVPAKRDWIGPNEPRSPLRALDKYMWWENGGRESAANMDRTCRGGPSAGPAS